VVEVAQVLLLRIVIPDESIPRSTVILGFAPHTQGVGWTSRPGQAIIHLALRDFVRKHLKERGE
jgi:hypothetical protein